MQNFIIVLHDPDKEYDGLYVDRCGALTSDRALAFPLPERFAKELAESWNNKSNEGERYEAIPCEAEVCVWERNSPSVN